MKIARIIFGPLYWLAGKIFATWARPDVQPDIPAELLDGSDAEICYVLESGGLADTLALERQCEIHGLPSPSGGLNFAGIAERRRIVVMRRMRGFMFRRKRRRGSTRLQRLVDASIAAGGKELLLIPVAIY
jgi:glycerol-3-phosphate O-acyltransferase